MSLAGRGGPLAGLRVVELTRVWAGPYAGKQLAFLGAEVIKVESLGSLDASRSYGKTTLAISPGFRAVNPQKLSVQMDMKTDQGRALVLRLLEKTDVVIENLRPGAADRLGVGYEAVKAVNPGVVYVSMSMYGKEGPLSYQTGYAPCFVACGGLTYIVGYENEPPTGMNIRYADSTFGAAAAYAAVVALMHRRRTGIGQFIDVSACETASSMIGDILMDHALNGKVQACDGNRHPEMAPHGVYPCLGGAWISIAAPDDGAWRALAETMDGPRLAGHPHFRSLADRKVHEPELDRLISAWTAAQEAPKLARLLQSRGVPAAKSLDTVDLCSDEALWARGAYRTVSDAWEDSRPIVGPAWRMTGEAAIVRGGPALGEHNAYVLGEILGLSPEEQQRLADSGATR